MLIPLGGGGWCCPQVWSKDCGLENLSSLVCQYMATHKNSPTKFNPSEFLGLLLLSSNLKVVGFQLLLDFYVMNDSGTLACI